MCDRGKQIINSSYKKYECLFSRVTFLHLRLLPRDRTLKRVCNKYPLTDVILRVTTRLEDCRACRSCTTCFAIGRRNSTGVLFVFSAVFISSYEQLVLAHYLRHDRPSRGPGAIRHGSSGDVKRHATTFARDPIIVIRPPHTTYVYAYATSRPCEVNMKQDRALQSL